MNISNCYLEDQRLQGITGGAVVVCDIRYCDCTQNILSIRGQQYPAAIYRCTAAQQRYSVCAGSSVINGTCGAQIPLPVH